MKILFAYSSDLCTGEMEEACRDDGYGVDEAVGCSASFINHGKATIPRRNVGSGTQVIQVWGVWRTAMSAFTYSFLPMPSEYNDWRGHERLCLYEGARAGFLAQNLLPVFGDTTILAVSGTYGTFVGDGCMDRYADVKDKWSKAVHSLGVSMGKVVGKKLNQSDHARLSAKLWEGLDSFPTDKMELLEQEFSKLN